MNYEIELEVEETTYDLDAPESFNTRVSLTEEVKQAMLQIAQKVAYIDGNGQTYYQALYDALYVPYGLVSIYALFQPGSTIIYDNMTLDELKQYLTVTAFYSDGTQETLRDASYDLSGVMEIGDQTITVSYGAKTTSFNVTVSGWTASIEAVFTQSGIVYSTDTLESLKTNLVVTARNVDDSTFVIPASDYTLSGSLDVGISTIVVSYHGKTDTFEVTVSQYMPDGYVTDGLIFFLDAKHGFSGDKWTDLIGKKTFDLTNCDWRDNCVIFDGTSYGEYQGAVSTNWKTETIEIVFENSATNSNKTLFSQPYIGSNVGSSMRFGEISGGKGNVTQSLDAVSRNHPKLSTLTTGNKHYITLYNNNAIVDGSKITETGWTSYSKNQTGITYLGANRFTLEGTISAYFIGKIFAVRIYNRLLTEAEILANQQNDTVYYGA